mmetsp:Transcript_23603/g.30608  ORF Transcript_23603/g.30608 Transcript_23603/m.30608 type:complete len:504 (+) Transcript_23603:117-1628(+)
MSNDFIIFNNKTCQYCISLVLLNVFFILFSPIICVVLTSISALWNCMDDKIEKLYVGKECLAPMVRAGTLPLRSLALHYGADTVWGEEIIDRRITQTKRVLNEALGTTDYVTENRRSVVFRTHPGERDKIVYQIGTADAVYALQAAQHVEQDVAAIDINMGCPKQFSTGGGMGAALLSKPEVAEDILKTLRRNLSVPVSCKMRLLGTVEKSVEYARCMEKAGAQAIAVHMRTLQTSEKQRAIWDPLRPIVQAVSVPVIANGDLYSRQMMKQIQELSGCSSVMLARPALYNISIFDKNADSLVSRCQVIKEYVQECIRWDNVIQNSKYTVMEMMRTTRHPEHLMPTLRIQLPDHMPGFKEVAACKKMEKLVALYNLADQYKEAQIRWGNARKCNGQVGEVCRPIEPARRYSDAYFRELRDNYTDARKCAFEMGVGEGSKNPGACQLNGGDDENFRGRGLATRHDEGDDEAATRGYVSEKVGPSMGLLSSNTEQNCHSNKKQKIK